MFQIKQQQIDVLDRAARTNFHQRLAAYLRREMPEQTAPYGDEALLKYIAASNSRAAKQGIETEAGIAQWTCLALVRGLDFGDEPEMREYFKAPGLAPEEKLEILVDALNEALLDTPEAQP